MAIINVPADAGIEVMGGEVECVVCGECIALEQATAGLRSLASRQEFACNQHFKSSGQYIVGWADFAAGQRLTQLHTGDNTENGGLGGTHAGWVVC